VSGGVTVAFGSNQREIRFWDDELVQHYRVYTQTYASPPTARNERAVRLVSGRTLSVPDGTHNENLTVDELHAIRCRQNTGFRHP
jgi:hypothetical protein